MLSSDPFFAFRRRRGRPSTAATQDLDPNLQRLFRRIFDAAFYMSRHPEAGKNGDQAFEHFIKVGVAANLRPHPLFDPGHYLKMNPDVAASGMPAIRHYLCYGGREWRVFSPLVDQDAYWENYRHQVALTETGSALEDFVVSEARPAAFYYFDHELYGRKGGRAEPFNRALEDFFTRGLAAGRDPHALIEMHRLVGGDPHGSPAGRFEALFDPGSELAGVATHAMVDPKFYGKCFGPQAIHPVLHFLRNGRRGTELTLHPLFDPAFYCRTFGTRDSVAALVAYVKGGMDASWPNAFFDPVHYRRAHAGAIGTGASAVEHYMANGHLPWFAPSPRFAQRFYLSRYPEAAASGEPALVHFLWVGRRQGHSVRPQAPVIDPTLGRTREAVVAEIRTRARAVDEPVASVIVPVHGEADVTLRCVLSALRARDATPFELVIVDDASPDGTGAVLDAALGGLPGIRVVRNESNLGFLRTCNAAADTSSAPFLYFLNNDTIVLDGWLDELVETFGEVSEAGLVGAKLLYPDGVLQEAGGIVWEDGSAANFGRLDDPEAPAYNYRRDVDYVSGAAILVRSDAWRAVGGFSTAYAPAYYEDTDLAMKLRAAGFRVVYQPLATVVHVEGVSSGTDVSSGVKRYQFVNRERFATTWRDALVGYGRAGDFSRATVDRRSKGRILFFDAEVPTPDRDSGSITTFHYLKILTDIGYRVTFIAENGQKHGRYGVDLQRLGIEVLSAPYVTSGRDYVLAHGDEYDLIVLARAPVGGRFLPALKAAFPSVPVVFDTVDLHHLRLMRQFEQTQDEAVLGDALAMKSVELGAIRAADATLLVSEVEVATVRAEIGPFPHAVIPLIYAPYTARTSYSERRDVAFVGSYRHPPNVDAAQYLVERIWPKARTLPGMEGARLYLVGSHMTEEVRSLSGESVVAVGHVENLEAYLEGIRITVAPLRFGAGVKGKIGNSLRLGVPVVATPIAIEGMRIEDEKHVLVAADEQQFAERMAQLYGDVALWERLSAEGRHLAEERFSIAAATERLETLCAALLSPRGRSAEVELRQAPALDERPAEPTPLAAVG